MLTCCLLLPCRHNVRHWIYPSDVPERAYQLAMIKTALLHNTLVCVQLPEPDTLTLRNQRPAS